MTKEHVINNGAQVTVVFDFWSGTAAIVRREGAATASIAIRGRVRGVEAGGAGTIEGQPVEVLKIGRSPNVATMTLVEVRFIDAAQDAE